MPTYIIFLIHRDRPNPVEGNEEKINEEEREDPIVQEVLKAFQDWVQTELQAGRIKNGETLLPASEETNVRIDFFTPTPESMPEGKEGETSLPPPKTSVKHGFQDDVTKNMTAYYLAEFPTIKQAIVWGQSCPLYTDGFALEIRQLQEINDILEEAPPESIEWTGDFIVSKRKELIEEGKMKKDEDGTLWVKVEDEGGIKEMIAEAEEREAKKEKGKD